MSDANNPDIDLTSRWTQSGEPNFDSSDNAYLDTINDIERGYVKTGAYGGAWGSVSLPATPSTGKWCIRINTDDSSNVRIYVYNGSAWKSVQLT
jgi:hypothetical protein